MRRLVFFLTILAAINVFCVVQSANAFENDVVRSRDQYSGDFSYYVYPIGGDIPGLGTAFGVGASILNFNNSATDFTGFSLKGDFEASGYTFLDIHLLPQKLILDVGYYDFLVSPIQYQRGLASDKEDYILPKAKGRYFMSQLTWTAQQRQYESYLRYGAGKVQLLEVLTKDGEPFDAIDDSVKQVKFTTIGTIADLTDDRLDPRKGMRFEAAANLPSNDSEFQSGYFVTDLNFTAYQPFFRRDTLAYNLFFSGAHVYNKASTDYAFLQKNAGLHCENRPSVEQQQACEAAESSYLNSLIAENKYGRASSLGGTQRLRSFSNGRYYAGNTLFYGLEYRVNFAKEHTPFNYYIAKGVRTGMQMSFFYEQGSVADSGGDLFKDRRSSYGVGFRLLLSGVIIRADYANGSEGSEFILFFDYPWSMFSVDNPG